MKTLVLALTIIGGIAVPAMAAPALLTDDALDRVAAGASLSVGGTTLTFTNFDVINVNLSGVSSVTASIGG